ncbi:MAG: HlyC/CorC family transporter [Clostridia bacterium]|nr:HlyC/CorC family transporter [Clostridia bacterium]
MDDPGPNFTAQFLNLAAENSSGSNLVFQILLLLVLILVNAFFAMSEMAVVSLNDARIEKMAEDGHKKAKLILKLTKNPTRFLSTIQIGVTLAGFLTSASAATAFAEMLTNAITASFDVPENIVSPIAVVLITLVMSYFSLVLGELAPKRIGMQVPEKIAFAVAKPLLVISKITAPFVKFLSLSTNGVVRLLGFDPNANEEVVTEEEIRMMVDVGGEKGVIEDTQKEMINNIFEFDDMDAGDIMTHRTDVVAADINDITLEDFMNLAIEHGRSRIPLYDEDIDNIVGIVYVKDLLKFVGKEVKAKGTLKNIMREPYFIPETKSCGELFKEMSSKRIQMAVVVDEYGGTAGIVTLEDIVEAIMGNIQDEYDVEEEEISKIDENTFTVDGTIDIEEIDELIGKELPEGDYETLAGFIMDELQCIPKDGEMNEVVFENVKFTVLSVEDRRIEKIKVEITPVEEASDEEEDED